MLNGMYPIDFVLMAKMCNEEQKDRFYYWDQVNLHPPIHKTDNRKVTHQRHLAIAAQCSDYGHSCQLYN
jgi:hypothetical protein